MGKKKKKPTTSMVAKIDGITDPDAAQKIQADIAKSKRKHAPEAQGTFAIGDPGKILAEPKKKYPKKLK